MPVLVQLGVLNLRGAIVPTVESRVRFNLSQADFTSLTVIMALSDKFPCGQREFALVVDGSADAVNWKPTPQADAERGQSRDPVIKTVAAMQELLHPSHWRDATRFVLCDH